MIENKKKLEGVIQGIPQFVKGCDILRSNPKPEYENHFLPSRETYKVTGNVKNKI